ncbi:hypothetical protein [Sphingomonas sp. 3-13AW]|uniref:hypothetical protein n=1 Tax=Sphingomonas sp. 3-13AW TaxID=3050450 RepID=UPI003BB704A0
MYYAIAEGHLAIAQLIEVSDAIAEDRKPRSCSTAVEVAEMLLRSIWGAPDASEFDVLALESEDQDIHLLLRRKRDGILARASYIEGEDLADDIDAFEFVTHENLDQIITRFNRWCALNLEEENDTVYRALIADMIPVEETGENRLTTDLLMIAPTLGELENLNGQVRTEALREVISNALVAIKEASRRR